MKKGKQDSYGTNIACGLIRLTILHLWTLRNSFTELLREIHFINYGSGSNNGGNRPQNLRFHVLKEGADGIPGLIPELVHFGVLGLGGIPHYLLLNKEVEDSLDVILAADDETMHLYRIAFLGIFQEQL